MDSIDKWVWFVGLEYRLDTSRIEYLYIIGPKDGYTMATKVAKKFGEGYSLVQLVRQGKAEEL